MPKPIDPADTLRSLDQFGDLVAKLGSDTAYHVMNALAVLYFNPYVPLGDRTFANAQSRAIKRAVHRAAEKAKKRKARMPPKRR